MKEQISFLNQLQALEKKKKTLTAQKAKVDSEETRRLWQEIRLLTQNLAAERERLTCLEMVSARQEADLATLASQCKALESRLYGGAVSHGKELEQLRGKWENARKEMADREAEAIANLEYLEELSKRIAVEEETARAIKRRHVEEQQKMNQQIAALETELKQLEEEYKAVIARVEPGYLTLFRDLSRKLATPVARVENGICGGCRRGIPISQMGLLAEKMVFCDNCGRILLVD